MYATPDNQMLGADNFVCWKSATPEQSNTHFS